MEQATLESALHGRRASVPLSVFLARARPSPTLQAAEPTAEPVDKQELLCEHMRLHRLIDGFRPRPIAGLHQELLVLLELALEGA